MSALQTTDARATGQFMTLPVEIKAGLQVSRLVVRGAPWFPPPLQGMAGHDIATGELRLVITSEAPMHAVPLSTPISKEDLEELHLQKFCVDFCLAQGVFPYRNARRGGEPPDFIVDGEHVGVRLDCTQFAVATRRQAHALFTAVRTALFEAPSSDYEHLRGLMVFVWAEGKRGSTDLPPRSPERQVFLDALCRYRFNPEAGVTTGLGPMPLVASHMDIQSADGGWRFLATPIGISAPASPFFQRNGFELAFHYPTDHRAQDLWDELARLIQKHDKPEVDELLVTIGAPDRSGFIYPGELVLHDFMLENVQSMTLSLQHLKRVFVHSWETGRVMQLWPEPAEIAPPMATGFVPAHHVLRPR